MVALDIKIHLRSPSAFFLGLGLIVVLTLLGAYLVEVLFGAPPCLLCLYQRASYAGVIFLCIAGLFLNQTKWRNKSSVILAGLCASALFSGAILALYHMGVENGWWRGTAGCIAKGTEALTVGELKEAILSAPMVSCGDITWSLLGLSLATWNLLWSTFLSLVSIYVVRIWTRDK